MNSSSATSSPFPEEAAVVGLVSFLSWAYGCLMVEVMISLSYRNRPLCRWLSCLLCESLSRFRLFVTPWTAARQAPLSMGFFRQEYWSGLPCPPPGDLPDPGIEPGSLTLQVDSLTIWATREAQILLHHGLLKSAGCRDAQLIIISWHMDYKPCSLPMQSHAVFIFDYDFMEWQRQP